MGNSGVCANTTPPPYVSSPHAVLWDRDGTPHDLGTLGGPVSGASSINSRGDVSGTSSTVDGFPRPFLWTPETRTLLKLEPPAATAPPRPRWLQRALELVHARSAEPLGLAALAQSAGVHPVYFVRAFRAHVGATPGAYLRRLRVDRAAAKLIASEESIAGIALDTGFSDQSHLTRVFRAALGITPAQYRDRFRRS